MMSSHGGKQPLDIFKLHLWGFVPPQPPCQTACRREKRICGSVNLSSRDEIFDYHWLTHPFSSNMCMEVEELRSEKRMQNLLVEKFYGGAD